MRDYTQTYEAAGRKYNIDPRLLRAVHHAEDASGDPNAASRAGAIGHMQIMPDTARRLGVDPHDPEQSIYGAARLLDENMRRYGNVTDALRAYNAGTDPKKWGNKETMAYPQKVQAAYGGQTQGQQEEPNDALARFEADMAARMGHPAPTAASNAPGPTQDLQEEPNPALARFEADMAERMKGPANTPGWGQKAATWAGDAYKSANRELVRTGSDLVVNPVAHLIGYLAEKTGHDPTELYNASKNIDAKLDDYARPEEKDWGAQYSHALGRTTGDVPVMLAGDGILSAAGSAVPAATRAGRILGNALTGKGSVTAKATQNALSGAMAGAATSKDGERTENALLGGVMGGTAPVVLKAGSRIIQAMTPAQRLAKLKEGIFNHLDPEGAKQKQILASLDFNHLTANMLDEGVHRPIIDRLAKEDAARGDFGTGEWNMGPKGYDTRQAPGLSRPALLATIRHEGQDYPLIVQQGWQNTSRPDGKGQGINHIEFGHGQEIRDAGHDSALSYLRHIISDGSDVHLDPKTGSYTIVSAPKTSGQNKDLSAMRLHREGDHFTVITAYPAADRQIRGDIIARVESPGRATSTTLSPQGGQDNQINANAKAPFINISGGHGPDLHPEDNIDPDNVKPLVDSPTAAQQEARQKAGKVGFFVSKEQTLKIAKELAQTFEAGGPNELFPSEIPDVHLTRAQMTGNAGLANLENNVRAIAPNAFAIQEAANNEARRRYLTKITGTEFDLGNAKTERKNFHKKASAAFENEQPVDVRPVLDELENLLDENGGNGHVETPIANSVKNLKKAIKRSEARGAPEGHALPSRIWNTRKFISEGLAKDIDQKNSLQEASAQLYPIVDMLTDHIEKGAPGFKENYLPRYAEYSRNIDAMRYLQRKTTENAKEKLQLGHIHTILQEIRRARISENSTSGAAAVSEDQIAKLEALRRDLLKVSRSEDNKKSVGSNTAQNLITQGRIAGALTGKPGYGVGLPAAALGAGTDHTIWSATLGAASYGARYLAQKKQQKTEEAIINALVNHLLPGP